MRCAFYVIGWSNSKMAVFRSCTATMEAAIEVCPLSRCSRCRGGHVTLGSLETPLNAVTEDRLVLYGVTAENEEQLSQARQNRQRLMILEAAFNPKVVLHRADIQHLLVIKEEPPLEESPSLDQEDPEPPHIKEEDEELWTSQEAEQLHGLEEADDTKFPSTGVHVKTEEDEERPQSIQPLQCQTGEGREEEPGAESSAGQSCFSCSECGKGFKHRGNLKLHMRVHTGKKPFGCGECVKRFTTQGNLKLHMRVHTGEKPFSCGECGKRFTRQQCLNMHMRVHTGEKVLFCGCCGKRFITQGYLKRHMRVHTGEKPFVCSECGKRFTRQEHLKRHIRVHTGEKHFVCDDCGKKFTTQWNLKDHMKVHTGEKPFVCGDCGKRFTQRGNLKQHMRCHTGEKPYGCRDCGKRFNHRGHLKKHMRHHTGDKPLSCGD
uniref:oocyte zinc finger protein XlCOF6.1-like isoform X2 n=1 Tax=Monopterus albus TaxID=43700 RepID=UPI0009B36CC8|nr:oocyte zinc finger protein XlCOF6.1-like isoform X2 [Monopterus albus]